MPVMIMTRRTQDYRTLVATFADLSGLSRIDIHIGCCSLGDMDVVAVRVQQPVRDCFMRPLAARPWAEQLHRVIRGLRPSAMRLQRLVELVAQIASLLFFDQTRALLRVGRGIGFAHRLVPFLRPLAYAFAASGVDVSRASEAMQAQRAALECEPERLLGAEPVRLGELLQNFA